MTDIQFQVKTVAVINVFCTVLSAVLGYLTQVYGREINSNIEILQWPKTE